MNNPNIPSLVLLRTFTSLKKPTSSSKHFLYALLKNNFFELWYCNNEYAKEKYELSSLRLIQRY